MGLYYRKNESNTVEVVSFLNEQIVFGGLELLPRTSFYVASRLVRQIKAISMFRNGA